MTNNMYTISDVIAFIGIYYYKKKLPDLCLSFDNTIPKNKWFLVLKHVTEQLLHGCVSNSSVEEQQFNPLWTYKV